MKNGMSDIEKEKIRKFADTITPYNWNVVLTPKHDRLEPGMLNILLNFKSSSYDVYLDGTGQTCYSDERGVETCRKMIPGGMLFMDLRDIGIDRNGKVAQIVVHIWPQHQQLKKVLLQELGRVVLIRRMAFRTKAFKEQGTMVVKEDIQDPAAHQEALDHAVTLLSKRALRAYGDTYLENGFL